MKKLFTFMLLLIAATTVSMAQDTWTVAGTAAALNGDADWSQTNAANDMTSTDGNIFTLTVTGCTLEKGVNYQYKVVKNHNWTEAYPQSNKTFSVQETAIYTVVYTFNATNHAVSETPTKTGNAGEVTHIYSLAGVPASVFGSEWNQTSTATEMSLDPADGLFKWKAEGIELAAKSKIEFKVVVDHSWGLAYPSDNCVKTIESDGLYNLTFTFNATTKDVDCVAEKKEDAVIEQIYVVAGNSEVLFGTEWDATSEANRMAKNANGVWQKTYTNVQLPAGVVEWKVVHNGSEWIPDGDNLELYVHTEDTYDVVFSFDEKTQATSSQLLKDGEPIVFTPGGEGWPANYGGVMLQAFYWNSYEDTQWRNLTAQAETLSKYYDILWVPNSSNCVAANSMGYLPVYWFDQRSSFGSRERYLREMISTYREHGTKIIEDVILNHKSPVGKDGSYIDFANETWTWDGTTYEINWTGADICQNDDGGYIKSLGFDVTGANDTGDDFSGARDLDHTSPNVQKNCKIFCDYLLKDVGYAGFRLDMVKGYSPEYTKMYNEYSKPEFCVGEYWDGYDAIVNWIKGTGYTSAAFDFPLKYVFRDAFGNGDWSAFNTKGLAGDPEINRYSVTFVDNHDTYENEGRLVNGVLGANAFILAMPGTPCIFLKHWQRYPIAIGNMILARKACGITNQSPIVEQQLLNGGYVIKVQGTKGTVLCLAGNPQYDATGFRLIAGNRDFRYYVSDNVTVNGLREGNDDEEAKDITVYIEADEAPYVYAWQPSGVLPCGEWPGKQLTNTATTPDGKTFWTADFSVVPVSIVINNGQGVQTEDINDLTHDSYFTFDATNSDKESNWTNITSQYYTASVSLPECAKPIDGHVYAYFQANKDYDSPFAWVWNDAKNFCSNTNWPGDKLKWVGTDGNDHQVWLWDGGAIADGADMPTFILFSNNGAPKTDDFPFENGGYYDATGLLANADQTTGVKPVVDVQPRTATIYNMQGQRVDANYRGLVIQNGRKVMVK